MRRIASTVGTHSHPRVIHGLTLVAALALVAGACGQADLTPQEGPHGAGGKADDPTGSGAVTVNATANPDLAVLGQILRLRSFEDADHGTIFRLFETGGGDPAMNGDVLVLQISSNLGGFRTYETGIDVNTVTNAELSVEGDDVALVVYSRVDVQDEAGNIRSKSATHVLTYLGPSSGLMVQGGPNRVVTSSNDSRWTALDAIFAIHLIEAQEDGVIVRLFETTGGGDLNGDVLLLHLTSLAAPTRPAVVFETGVDVNSVTGVALDAGAATLKVKTEVDTLQEDVVVSGPRTYTFRYFVDDEGAIGQTLSVAAAQ